MHLTEQLRNTIALWKRLYEEENSEIYNDEEASLMLMEAKSLLTKGNNDMDDKTFDEGMAIVSKVETYLAKRNNPFGGAVPPIEVARREYGKCKFLPQDKDDCMERDCPLYHTCHRR